MRKQNEVIYGRILQIPELQQRVEKLEAENTRLKNELEACVTQSPLSSVPKESNVTPLSTKRSKTEISDTIRSELEALSIKITSTLTSKIRNSTEEIVLTAIEALKKQLQHQTITSPGGWLARAIDDGWQPNTPLGEDRILQPNLADIFGKWYDLARVLGVARGSRKNDDGSIEILENTGQWVSFEQISAKWTIDHLESRMKK